ncbi:MAG TPA: selenocysteine-specific translation elongation factor [Longimicrobiales bacterium]
MKRVILGTAGHIDHGKTTLVKALTGIDTDRLPEEKARGITIDLGFAHLQLDDLHAGIVDVPGHEGLIRNMLAGATGFDAMMLVIAADEGIMPQTREHLAIAGLLGVQRMVVALTKSDLVDEEWLALVREEVATLVGDAPIVTVSAATGQGLDELRAQLKTQLAQAAVRSEADLFRMPIDRVFSVRGTGTVVTGTVWSGCARKQERARVLPAGHEVRIRGVESHGHAVDAACAGERAAFALVGVERADIGRGQVLVTDDAWQTCIAVTARVQLLGGEELTQRQRVRLHLGTAEVLARVHLLDDDWVQLRLEEVLVARVHDRFVLRSYSPVRTIGGGTVAELVPRKRLPVQERELLTRLLDGDTRVRMRAAIELAAVWGCSTASMPLVAAVSGAEVAAYRRQLPDDVVMVDDVFYSTAMLVNVTDGLRAAVADYHRRHPLAPGIERARLLGPLPQQLAEAALRRAAERGLVRVQGSTVALADFRPELSARQEVLREQLLARLRAEGLAPPQVSELAAELKSTDVGDVLRLLEARGEVKNVATDWFVDAAALARAVGAVRSLPRGPLPASEFKTALPVSRKYLIPLLEYLDRVGVTRREGDLRWIEPGEPPETA